MKTVMNNQKNQRFLKILVVLTILKISAISVIFAQSHEYSAYLGSGLSTLRYKPSDGNRSGRMGVDFGFGYSYVFHSEWVTGTGNVYRQDWGIHTGIGLGLYNAMTKLNDVKTVTNLNDGESRFSDFELHTTLSDYNEKQNTMYLTIPAMGLFQLDRYYAMGGFKFGIPLNRKYKYQDATLTNIAYYPELENSITDKKDRGIGVFEGENFKNKLDVGVVVMFSLEGGVTWEINPDFTLYTGIYFDYGLNNIVKGDRKGFGNYNPNNREDYTTNSVLSSYTDNRTLTTFTDKVNIMAIGIKVRLAMQR